MRISWFFRGLGRTLVGAVALIGAFVLVVLMIALEHCGDRIVAAPRGRS